MSKNLEIIGKIESLLDELKASLGATPQKHGRASAPKALKTGRVFLGLTADIFNLVQDGFFKEPQEISEIQNKLRLEGINKPTTSLSGPLVQLIKKKVLTREEPANGKGPFKYRQR
jgi:hypothetical protein